MRDLRAALLVLSCCAAIVACSGGGGSPGTTPAAPGAPASPAAPEAPAAPAAAPAPAAPPLAGVIAAVLDSRPMAMYLHPEIEGRVPVAISGPALAGARLDAVAQGQPVVMRTEAEAAADQDAAIVIFERVDVTEATAEVELRYPIEGIVGRFRLEREGEGWRIVKAELVER